MSALFKIKNFKNEFNYVISENMLEALELYKDETGFRAQEIVQLCFVEDIIGFDL